MKLLYKYICIILLLVLSAEPFYSQVTIGSNNPPAEGMLLQLKNVEPDAESFNNPLSLNNVTCTDGALALPRIRLVGIDSFEPFIVSATEDDKQEHMGMMVYNVNEDDMCVGLYIWEGSKWDFLREADTSYKKATDSRDGSVYYYKTFDLAGDWMVQNLRYRQAAIGKYPNNDSSLPEEYGLLYTWNEATGGKDEVGHGRVQGLCPAGWHIPSDAEWNLLEKVLAEDRHNRFVKGKYEANPWQTNWESMSSDRGTHGRILKSTESINGQTTNGQSRLPKCGGFEAFLVGILDASATTLGYGTTTSFWSSSIETANKPFERTLSSTSEGVKRGTENANAYKSVRCKKD